MAKKKNQTLGYGKPQTIEVEVYTGAVIVDAEERAVEILEMMEAAAEALKPIQDFITDARTAVTEFQRTRGVRTVQLDGHYWRLVERFTRYWVATPADMPTPKPKGAKSLREICKGKADGNGKPLWNFITRRVPDAKLIDQAVKEGFITTKEIQKAYLEKPQTPFIQRYDGVAVEDDEDE